MNSARTPFLFGAVVGSGLTAKAADSAGANYLLALNAGRFRVQGASSLTSFLPVRPANDWVMEFAERELLGRCTAPIYAGYSVSDPQIDLDDLIEKTVALGFAGICNFPSVSLIDGRLGALMESEGLGFSREVDLAERATAAGLKTFAYVQTNKQARRMVDAGAGAICVNVGFTSGATGVSTHLTLEAAAARIDRVLDGVPSDIDKLCHGGPITSPEDALTVMRMCSVQGLVAGSTLDKIPLENTLSEVTKGFTAIPNLARRSRRDERGNEALIGGSSVMQQIKEELDALAHDDLPILITGETGTGKSLAASRVHAMGPKAHRKSVVVDCPAVTELDGDVYLLGLGAGARAGSASQRGALEQAADSTLILEDVAALSLGHQGKLLKFVDEGLVQRIGEHSTRAISARVVSTAMSEDVLLAENGLFRHDLYYRLSGHVIELPPLRDRIDDIADLISHFGRKLQGGEEPVFTNAALRVLFEHSWPGNLRELRNAVSRAVRISQGKTIGLKEVEFLNRNRKPEEVPAAIVTASQKPGEVQSERDWIASALARNGFRRAQTAQDLGMTTRTLYNKIKRYGLQE